MKAAVCHGVSRRILFVPTALLVTDPMIWFKATGFHHTIDTGPLMRLLDLKGHFKSHSSSEVINWVKVILNTLRSVFVRIIFCILCKDMFLSFLTCLGHLLIGLIKSLMNKLSRKRIVGTYRQRKELWERIGSESFASQMRKKLDLWYWGEGMSHMAECWLIKSRLICYKS